MTTVQPMHFDPEQFAKNFFSIVAKTHRSVGDVFFLNAVFMWQKGCRSPIKSDSASEAEELIAYLKSVYGIKDDNDKLLEEDSVTLERVHFAFPIVACRAAAVGAEQRKANSQLSKVMAIIECPAFARFCSSLVEFGDKEGLLFVDAYCWGQYLHACKGDPGTELNTHKIRERALEWKASFSLEDLAEIFEQKLYVVRTIDDMMLDESNVQLGLAELHRSLQSASSHPNVDFIVDQAIFEKPFDFVAHGKVNETFLNTHEVVHFSGALLCYLTSIKRRLCRANRVSPRKFESKENFPELFTILREAAIAVLNATPDRIIELMGIAGLRVCWGNLVHAAHERVRPLIRNVLLVKVPQHMTRLNMAKVGLEMTFSESKLLRGSYPSLIRKWASAWRRIYTENEC